MEQAELLVVGAGLYGLTAAVTYHRLHPTARILILDSAPYIGGPWGAHRSFPGLKTNNLLGTYENPDFPMDEAKFGVQKGTHVPATKVAEYLKALVEENGLSECVRLNTKVEVIEKTEEGWRLDCNIISPNADPSSSSFITAKLIIAIGTVSRPSMPRFPPSPDFTPVVIHSYDFPQNYSSIVKQDSHSLVVGAGKSAWDIAYACATQPNSTATMLVRPSGNGPLWHSPSHVTPFGLWLEKLVFTRFFGLMSPCPWAETSGPEGWVRSFLHNTWLGRKIVGAFWNILGDDVVQVNKLNDHPETKKLRPWGTAFESGNKLSILNYPTDFFDLVREGKIKIVIDEINTLGKGKEVILKSGQKLKVDAVACATGWKIESSVKFKPDGLEKELGLPTKGRLNVDDTSLLKKVESDIYSRFPFLATRDASKIYHPDPAFRQTPTLDPDQQPYRLYRFLVPLSDVQRRSIGFAGALMSLGQAPCAYLQALWLTAYLDGSLTFPSTSSEKMKYETYRDTQYCILRNSMGYGNKFPDLVFDSLPYFDLLMKDLGFNGKRKGSILGVSNLGAEYAKSYGPEDYRGLVDSWRKGLRDNEEAKKKV